MTDAVCIFHWPRVYRRMRNYCTKGINPLHRFPTECGTSIGRSGVYIYCGKVLQMRSEFTRHLHDSCPNRKKDAIDETSISRISTTPMPSNPIQESFFPCPTCGKVHKHLSSLKRYQAARDSQFLESRRTPKDLVITYDCPTCDKTCQSF